MSNNWNPGHLTRSGLYEPGQPKTFRPWRIYDVTASCGELDGTQFLYFAECGSGKPNDIGTLAEAELFNGDLQKVDVTSTASLLAFCNKYGLPASPLYPGAARLEWFRQRFDNDVRDYEPVDLTDEDAATRAITPYLFHSQHLDTPESVKQTIPQQLLGLRPALLSERARAIAVGDRDVAGVISEAEVAQTVRALQIACVLPMAYQYYADNGGTTEDLLAYLGEKRFMSQAGPEYFLHVDENIVRGSRLDTFEKSMKNNPFLPSAVQAAEVHGLDVRTGYDIALSRGLWTAANNALRFLFESDASYRKSDYTWEWDNTSPDAKANPFARFSLHKADALGELPDFTATGSIGEVIIQQFIHLWADETPWRRCENCGRIFKKYREEKFSKNIRGTRFCRRSCNVSFNQRSKR